MPVLAKSTARIVRFKSDRRAETDAGAGDFSIREEDHRPAPPGLRSTHGEERRADAQTETPIDRLAHDVRNVLSGLMFYCDLIAAPGVLRPEHRHYAPELEEITKTAAAILDKIVAEGAKLRKIYAPALSPELLPRSARATVPPTVVTDAAAEVRRLRPLLSAIAGPSARLTVDTMPCPGLTALTVEDLTRVLVNLVRNAADAMPTGGRIRVTAQYEGGFSFLAATAEAAPSHAASRSPALELDAHPHAVLLTVSDNGPGIPAALSEQVFECGFSTHAETTTGETRPWPAAPRHRGLGLSTVRRLIEAAGGRISVTPNPAHGARFEIVLPIITPAIVPDAAVTSGIYTNPPSNAYAAGAGMKGCLKCL